MNRSELLDRMKTEQVDLLIIGGGITGAGIALDAQSRGMSTFLVEMQDFASGTSSRSTKLIHGGLRYLKQLQFGVVAQTGRERAIVYENARHITSPEWMMLPIYSGGTYGKWTSSLGILAYDYLAGVKRAERRQILSKEETVKREPLLRQKGLRGAGYYVEYRTDDARLTIEVLKKAMEFGAGVLNYVEATSFAYSNDLVTGINALDHSTGEEFVIRAKKVVNATGPWVDRLRDQDHSKKGKYLHWTKGAHIVVGQEKFPLRQSIYFDTPDGRMVFAIPRDGKVYIGTTDTNYKGDLHNPKATTEDISYLLLAANHIFPSINILQEDIEACWAGIRPLIHEEGKSPSEISRKDEIFYSPSGLITIAGGKLTGYRKMAESVVNRVAKELKKEGRLFTPCFTDRIIVSGGEIKDKEYFVESKTREGIVLGLSSDEAQRVTSRYGSNIDQVYEMIREGQEEVLRFGLSGEVYGALRYGLEQEMVLAPADFFVRRTGTALFDIAWVDKWKEPVLKYMQHYFNWTDKQLQQYTTQFEMEMEQFTTISL